MFQCPATPLPLSFPFRSSPKSCGGGGGGGGGGDHWKVWESATRLHCGRMDKELPEKSYHWCCLDSGFTAAVVVQQ